MRAGGSAAGRQGLGRGGRNVQRIRAVRAGAGASVGDQALVPVPETVGDGCKNAVAVAGDVVQETEFVEPVVDPRQRPGFRVALVPEVGDRAGPVTITLLTRAVLCGTHDACRLACDSFARKLFRGLSARSLREARAGARLRASCALARTGATRGASRAFRRRGRSCRGWRRNWG